MRFEPRPAPAIRGFRARLGFPAVLAGGISLIAVLGGCRSMRRPAHAPGADGSPPPSAALTQAIADGERESLARLPADSGRALVEGSCLTCHGAALIEQQRKDSAGWAKTLGQMRAWGAPLPEQQVLPLLAYLTKHYGAE